MIKNGFTLIELMIVLVIIGILAAVIVPAVTGGGMHSDHVCKGGFKFTYDGKQIIGQNASGVPCDTGPAAPGQIGTIGGGVR